jgi:hypothetical protein
MDMGKAVRQLDELPFAWTVGKGRVRPDEPAWAVQVFRQDKHGLALYKQRAFQVEGDSLDHCVTRVVAWAQRQER